ncbi:MAG: hypothetical protein V3U75_12830 [Methylococcaceae bacterium]
MPNHKLSLEIDHLLPRKRLLRAIWAIISIAVGITALGYVLLCVGRWCER